MPIPPYNIETFPFFCPTYRLLTPTVAKARVRLRWSGPRQKRHAYVGTCGVECTYQPGKLEAKAYSKTCKVVATDVVETTGPPAALHLSTNLTTLPADGEEVALIEIDVVDRKAE